MLRTACRARSIGSNRRPSHSRVNGWGWGRIGRLLGITRQGARKKFPLAPPAPPPHVVAADRYLKEQREGERLVERFRNGTLTRPEEEDPVFW